MSKSQILAKVSLFIIIKIPKVPKVLYSKLRTLKIDKNRQLTWAASTLKTDERPAIKLSCWTFKLSIKH